MAEAAWILVCAVALLLYLAKLWLDVRRARRDAARLIDAAVRRVVWDDSTADDGLSPARRARAQRFIRSIKDDRREGD